MTLNVLKNRYRIELADEDFLNTLSKFSLKFSRIKVVYEYFEGNFTKIVYENTDIYFLEEQNIWFSHIIKNNKSFFAFGMDKPKKDDSNYPICILDFSLKANKSNCKGAYAQDKQGNISVLLRNYDPELEKNLYKSVSNDLELTPIFDEDKKSYFFLICNLNDRNIREKIKNFVNFMDTMSNQDLNDTFNLFLEKSRLKEDNTTICIICGKNISNKALDSSLNSFTNNNKNTCLDCLEKINCANALKEIKEQVSLKLFTEKNLLKKVKYSKVLHSYLSILKKQEIIKVFSKDTYYLNPKIDLDDFIKKYSNMNYGKTISDDSLILIDTDLSNETNINTINSSSKSLESKICEACGKKLSLRNYYINKKSKDGLSSKCINCIKRDETANGLNEILKYVRLDEEFSKDLLIEKSVKLPSTISQYLWDLRYQSLIERNKSNDKYIIKTNDKLKDFCEEHNITINIQKTNADDVLSHKNIEKQIKLLEDKEWTVRRTAANKIGYIGDETAIIPLVKALKDDNLFVKINAVKSLGKIGDERAIEPLYELSNEKNYHLNKTALLAIEQIKANSIHETIINSSSNHSKVGLKVCEACGKELSFSEFYNYRANPDGLTNNCKKCIKERRAVNLLKEIISNIGFNVSFSKKTLKNHTNKSNSTLNAYLNDLTDLGLLKYDKSKDKYVLIKNDEVRVFFEKYDIISSKKSETTKNTSTNSSVTNIKVCEACGKELPVSEFYHTKNSSDGLMGYCKKCMMEKNAANSLKEIIKVVNFNSPFSKEKLSTLINKTNTTVSSYIRNLKNLGLLEHNESNDNYKLVLNDKVRAFLEKYDIQSTKISNISTNSSSKANMTNVKSCEGCGKKLSISENLKNHDGLINYCKDCTKELNASKGLSDIIKFFSINSTFPRKILEMKSNESKITIGQYLTDLIDLNLLDYHNKEKEIYSFILNKNLVSFCNKYEIELPKSNNFQMDYSIESKINSKSDSKICEVCENELSRNDFYKDIKSSDGLSGKCINCFKRDKAAIGLKEIIKYVKFDHPFTKAIIKKKSVKSLSVINQYLYDLTNLGFLEYNVSMQTYNLILNDKLSSFCEEYNIRFENQTGKIEELDNSLEIKNPLTSQIVQIYEETGSYFNLEFKEIVRKSEIMSILTELEEKIFNLKLLELLVKPDKNDSENQNYIIQVKIEVPSEDIKTILENLKSLDRPIKSQVEIFGLMKIKL